tara:strand:- start:10606 stop:10875 length:270 start_codon:yes stop_codon:yes gene_type:complete
MKDKETITFIVRLAAIALLAILLSLFVNAGEQSGSYQAGWDAGYSDGFCYQEPNCVPPLSPLCPVPTVNEENTYEGGYARGFSEGLSDQ